MSTETTSRVAVTDVLGNAGLIEVRVRRQTGRIVSIYNNAEQGLNDNVGTEPYSTVCEDHGGLVSHRTLALARSWAAEPLTWCESCQTS